jgi:hypothetical protein
MADNFNFSTQVGQNWVIPAAYYDGMSKSPTAGSVAAYAGLVRELGGMASDYMENRAGENKREASTDAALNMSRDLYGQAGFDTSALDKYLTPQPNENQGQYTARKESVLKVLPLWVELMKEKRVNQDQDVFNTFGSRLGSFQPTYNSPSDNQFSGEGLPTANEPEIPQGRGEFNFGASLYPNQ